MHWHWQNLNEKHGVKGSGWVNGRAWLHLDRAALGVQWVWSKRLQIGGAITFGGAGAEHDLSIHIHLAFFSLYLHTERVLSRLWQPKGYDDHEFRLELYTLDGDLSLAWAWNADPNSWRSKNPWWRKGMWHPADTLLGRAVYTQGAPEVYRIEVPMPEANYMGTCTLRNDTWKRPRWFTRTLRRADITMDEGAQVPFPGKGENSWDCGEDGIFGMTCPARDVPEAIASVVESALRSRAKNGGRDWKPAPTVEHLGI